MNLTVFATQLLLLYVMSCKLPKDRWCNWIDKYRPFLLIFRLRKMLVSKNFKIKGNDYWFKSSLTERERSRRFWIQRNFRYTDFISVSQAFITIKPKSKNCVSLKPATCVSRKDSTVVSGTSETKKLVHKDAL